LIRFFGASDAEAQLFFVIRGARLGAKDTMRLNRRSSAAEAGRFATPTAPRPASARDSPWGQDTSVVAQWIRLIPDSSILPNCILSNQRVDCSAQPPLMESSGVLVAPRAESQVLKVGHR
jgi:hypothetical protein